MNILLTWLMVLLTVYQIQTAQSLRGRDHRSMEQNLDGSRNETDLVVLVMSARGNFRAREVIRETWGKDEAKVIFVVGDRYCQVPPRFQSNFSSCEVSAKFSLQNIEKHQRVHVAKELHTHKILKAEARRHKDILLLNDIEDSYGNLAAKTKGGLMWTARHFPNSWVLKIDDDSIALLGDTRAYLQKFDPDHPYLIGEILKKSPVLLTGRWAESKYKSKLYPYYPQGSAGYILSPALIRIFAANENNLQVYRCEDASIGIWIQSLGLDVSAVIIDEPKFRKSDSYNIQDCLNETERGKLLTYSHHFSPDQIRTCYQKIQSLKVKISSQSSLWNLASNLFE